jgi:glycosyltransferase involved in cell wall biosynthesis
MSVSILTVTQGSRIPFYDILIKCVQNQTYSNICEWIIVDGSKTEKDSKALQSYWEKFRTQSFRCPVILSSPPSIPPVPIGKLRNIANSVASGDYIAWMDDDDYYFPSYIAHSLSKLATSRCEIAGCATPYMFDVNYQSVHQFEQIQSDHVTMNSCMIYKKEILRTCAYDNLSEDHEEIAFTHNFQKPMVQLDPASTMVLINHSDNIINRCHLVFGSHINMNVALKTSPIQLDQIINDKEALDFYTRKIYSHKTQCPYDIVYMCGGYSLPWTPHDQSLGGSEQAVVQLSKIWTRMGKKVCVYGELTISQDTIDGVDYFHYRFFNPNQHFKVLILWRYMGLSYMFQPQMHWYTADKIIVDMHDNLVPAYKIIMDTVNTKYYTIVFKSKYHVQLFTSCTGLELPWGRVAVIMNGVQTELFETSPFVQFRDKFRFCYTSMYARGLLEIFELWKQIVKLEPRVELHLYYGLNSLSLPEFKEDFYTALISTPNVCDHGRMPLEIVAEEKHHATFHLYPTNTHAEIDCIAIRESLVAGCIPILSYTGVFKERDGFFITGNMANKEDYPRMAQEIIELVHDTKRCDALRESFSRSRTICTWVDTAKEWIQLMDP